MLRVKFQELSLIPSFSLYSDSILLAIRITFIQNTSWILIHFLPSQLGFCNHLLTGALMFILLFFMIQPVHSRGNFLSKRDHVIPTVEITKMKPTFSHGFQDPTLSGPAQLFHIFSFDSTLIHNTLATVALFSFSCTGSSFFSQTLCLCWSVVPEQSSLGSCHSCFLLICRLFTQGLPWESDLPFSASTSSPLSLQYYVSLSVSFIFLGISIFVFIDLFSVYPH